MKELTLNEVNVVSGGQYGDSYVQVYDPIYYDPFTPVVVVVPIVTPYGFDPYSGVPIIIVPIFMPEEIIYDDYYYDYDDDIYY